MPTMERLASVSRREVFAGASAAGLTFLPSRVLGRGGVRKPAGTPLSYGGLISETSARGNIGFVQRKVLICDSKVGLSLNNDEANKALEVSYRQGFTLPVWNGSVAAPSRRRR